MDPTDALSRLLTWLDRWQAERPDEPLWDAGPTAAEYAQGLTRPSGSYVEEVDSLDALVAFFAALDPPREVTGDLDAELKLPGHRYWVAPVPAGYTAWQAALRLDEMPDEHLPHVRVIRGKHGLELRAPHLAPTRTADVVLITAGGQLVTWFPGRPAAFVELGAATVKLERA